MKATENIPLGAAATKTIEVTKEMTVAHFVESMPAVYGTPIMIYHMEDVAGSCIQQYLPEGWVSVGVVVNVKHLAATPVGMTVRARATLLEIDGRRYLFQVEAWDGRDKVAEGRHERYLIPNLARFLERTRKKGTG